jgi:hypothetical protein
MRIPVLVYVLLGVDLPDFILASGLVTQLVNLVC